MLGGLVCLLAAVSGVALACVAYQWEVYTAISGTVAITSPTEAQAYACINQEVSFTAQAQNWADTDRRRIPPQDWQQVGDSVKYVWSAKDQGEPPQDAGSWKPKEGPDNEGPNVTWIAPEDPGTYTVTVTADDKAEVGANDTGTRDDTPGEAQKADLVMTVVNVQNVTFDPENLYADGESHSTASATITPDTLTITWSIQGNALGCTINSSTGVITPGTTEGTITARAAASVLATCYAENNIDVLNPCLQTLQCARQIVGGLPNCDAGGGPTKLWSLDDQCGNTLEVWCRGYYSYEYNGKQIGQCRYKNGLNDFEYRMTMNRRRFHSTWHRTRDPDHDGSAADEGTPYKWDWIVYKYDCINGGDVEKICRESATIEEGDEYVGETSECE
jgi:hypothetical protein